MAAFAIVLGGMMSAFGMFNALVMSYRACRWLWHAMVCCRRFFAKIKQTYRCALGGDSGLRQLLGALFVVEFQKTRDARHHVVRRGADAGICHACLFAYSRARVKREFRVPGGLAGAITCGIFPLLLLVWLLWRARVSPSWA